MTKISELKEGEKVSGKFAVWGKDFLRDYHGGKFFKLIISDETGKIPLKFWGSEYQSKVVELYETIQPGKTVVELEGTVLHDEYEDKLVVYVNEDKNLFRICKPEEARECKFVPSTSKNRDELMQYIEEAAGKITEPNLAALLKSIFSDEEIRKAFMESPAAKTKHHAYIGGLLEHTTNVVRICATLCDIYQEIDRDLLITAAILHDIGKIKEYSVEATIDFTDAGRFLSHPYISIEIIESKLKQIPDFPEAIKLKLYHIILRHHGRASLQESTEQRSPWVIPEACALYYADDMDAKVKNFLQEVEEGRKVGENWRYVKDLGGQIYIEDEDE